MADEVKKKIKKKTENFPQISPSLVDMQGLALALGLSVPTVRSRLREGLPCVQQGGRGTAWQFDLAECVKWHTDRAVSKAMGIVDEGISKGELERQIMIEDLKIKRVTAAKATGEVALLEDVERAISNAFVQVRQAMLSIPERTALRLMAAIDETEVKAILEEEIDLALNALSEADLMEKVDDAER
jgi:phage terminase Nu1 subunit (DNA packaging protein)